MNTILSVMALVFGGAVVLALTFGPLVSGMTSLDRDLRWQWWVAIWVWTLTCVGIVAGCIALYAQQHPDTGPNVCADRGGVWSVTGHHAQLVGKVIQVPR